MSLAIVIPAYNEAAGIAETLRCAKSALIDLPHEIIVIDNESTDATPQIAAAEGVACIGSGASTIAGLRNRGVQASAAEFLVFIDADVSLTESWRRHIADTLEVLRTAPSTITGSRCQAPGDGFFNQHWFGKLEASATNYVNSGHMITTRALFDRIGGFDERLHTAEDYDFAARAIGQADARITPDPRLIAVHRGYPRSARSFLSREAWHGAQDFDSMHAFLASRVAQLAAAHWLSALLSLAVAVVLQPLYGLVAYLAAAFSLTLLFAWMKFPTASLSLGTLVCAYLYIVGRSLAPLRRMSSLYRAKRERSQ